VTIAGADSRIVRAGDGAFSYLEAGSGPPLVLLHGIGSAAASFRYQLKALSARFRVVAWDAPGYGASTPLAIEHPDTSDYTAALDAWLGALAVDRCHLVGQSLGTLIAARFAAEQPRRVLSLTLASIARGHGRLPRRSGSGFSRSVSMTSPNSDRMAWRQSAAHACSAPKQPRLCDGMSSR
jgi:pimeloyl-ACP methyl ester carboxylesterase